MHVAPQILKGLDLAAQAVDVTTTPVQRLPLLIIDKCLAGSESTLVRATIAALSSGLHNVLSETITMPRRTFGSRPIEILAPIDRVFYQALATAIIDAVDLPPRDFVRYAEHDKFGQDSSTDSFVVDFDIASYYEYVDHRHLATELLVQTADARVTLLCEQLTELFGVPRGLPQMLNVSDGLGDIFISSIERALIRSGYEVSRYADDFRVKSGGWRDAHRIIEQVSRTARSLGLVLSTEKTRITAVETLLANEADRASFFKRYFEDAREDLTEVDLIDSWYGEGNEVVFEPSEQEAVEEAFRRILREWVDEPRTERNHTRWISHALLRLQSSEVRISDKWLSDIAFWEPVKLPSVIRYIGKRPEMDANWRTTARLLKIVRPTAWSRLWMMNLIGRLDPVESKKCRRVQGWVAQLLADEHEIVRAEATWLLASWGRLTAEDLQRVHGVSSSLSRHALAASVAKQGISGAPLDKQLISAVKGDGPLSGAAFTWGGSVWS